MAICLVTDFGAGDLYVGQVEAVLDRLAPGVRVIHLLHEAPPYDIAAAAHLLAALAPGLAGSHVLIGVVDPGVGTARAAMEAAHWSSGGRRALSVVAGAARRLAASPARPPAARWFHGRACSRRSLRSRATTFERDLTPVEGSACARRRRPAGDHLHRPLRKRLTGPARLRCRATERSWSRAVSL
jgi:hypothetical protein